MKKNDQEEETSDPASKAVEEENGDAVDMNEDFGGVVEDLPKQEEEQEEEEDSQGQ